MCLINFSAYSTEQIWVCFKARCHYKSSKTGIAKSWSRGHFQTPNPPTSAPRQDVNDQTHSPMGEWAYECKKLCYTKLAADVQQRGWKAKVSPVKVGCKRFEASFHHPAPKRSWHPWRGSATDNYIILQSSGKKQPVIMGQAEGSLLGPKKHQDLLTYPPQL